MPSPDPSAAERREATRALVKRARKDDQRGRKKADRPDAAQRRAAAAQNVAEAQRGRGPVPETAIAGTRQRRRGPAGPAGS